MKISKKHWLRKYNGFNVLSDIGSGFVGRIKGYLPNFGVIILEAGALTVLFSSWHISVPWFLLWGFLVGKQYFWMITYYIAGLILKRIGFIKAQNEYTIEHAEDFNPMQIDIAETLESICQKLGAESKLYFYKELRAKKEAQKAS